MGAHPIRTAVTYLAARHLAGPGPFLSFAMTRRLPLPVVLFLLAAPTTLAAGAGPPASGSWRNDPAWYAGKAEWALYDAVRSIYGQGRHYEATIFTNKQHMDPATTTKVQGGPAADSIEVFKHNLSELIPTENYTYRFLTTCFVRTDTLEPYKVAFSSQEDCGTTYKQFIVSDEHVTAEQFCYFPGGGSKPVDIDRRPGLAFHDALSLTLRDYPFESDEKPVLDLDLVPDQTFARETPQGGRAARGEYVERTTVQVPYGAVDAHHLRVTHDPDGGRTTSDYWFAADPDLRHVMVRYEGPYGVRYELKRLAWWAYWAEPRP